RLHPPAHRRAGGDRRRDDRPHAGGRRRSVGHRGPARRPLRARRRRAALAAGAAAVSVRARRPEPEAPRALSARALFALVYATSVSGVYFALGVVADRALGL